jgi:putative hydrolase of the HAD superfamily
LEFKPFLLNEKIKLTMENLINNGYKLNLASNTGFIEGRVIINVLKELELFDYFDFLIFSDEIGASKPSALFYDCVYDKLKNNLNKNEVMHIGDNYYADFLGAIHYGFQALHICEQQFTYYDIIQEINEKNCAT